MNTDIFEKEEKKIEPSQPKYKQMVKMLTFRVVPAYYREIEKVAKNKKTTVSKLIRTYIKEGLKRDKELSSSEASSLERDTNMF